ncbi:MAG: cupredoxin domain-containing protein [Acidimicrobiales bacterium]
MHAPKSVLIGAAALMVVTVTACGDDSDDDDGGLQATATEFEFSPNEWTVPAGEFDLEFTNDGSTDHEWVIMNEPITSEAEFTEEGVLDEVETGAGETVTATFTVDDAGEYQIICGLEGHFDAGMEGTLTVE